jgi:hypothetical protein
MINVVDKSYFHELSIQDPNIICKRTECKYDNFEKVYRMSFWGDEYVIDPIGQKIECMSENIPNTHEYFQIFIIHYLLMKEKIEVCNKWISEKDIPGGSSFFTVSHEIPYDLISNKYGNDVQKFRIYCEQLNGSPIEMADATYCFMITPHVPVAVLYWVGDEDFSPQAKILFDKSISIFSLDVTLALAIEICSRIGNRWNPYALA